MKVSSLIQTALLAISMMGTAQAITPDAGKTAIQSGVSQHVIELDRSHCASHVAPENCSLIQAEAGKPVHGVQDSEQAQPVKAKRKEELATPVPEPKTFLMMMLGLVVLGFASARRGYYEKFSE